MENPYTAAMSAGPVLGLIILIEYVNLYLEELIKPQNHLRAQDYTDVRIGKRKSENTQKDDSVQ